LIDLCGWHRVRIKKRLINSGGWRWRWQWWKFFRRWEWCARVNLLEPSAEVRRIDAVWCAATGEQLFWLHNNKSALRVHLHAEWCEQFCNGTIALPREWRVIARHEEVNVADATCGGQFANELWECGSGWPL
jgi:hypothetical protein